MSSLDDEERRDIMEITENRYHLRSTIIATQFPVDDEKTVGRKSKVVGEIDVTIKKRRRQTAIVENVVAAGSVIRPEQQHVEREVDHTKD